MPFKFNFGQAADAGHALSVPEAAEALPAQEVHPEVHTTAPAIAAACPRKQLKPAPCTQGAPLVCSWDNVVAGGFGILKVPSSMHASRAPRGVLHMLGVAVQGPAATVRRAAHRGGCGQSSTRR